MAEKKKSEMDRVKGLYAYEEKKKANKKKDSSESRKGWKYGEVKNSENYMYMGRVPDPNAKKGSHDTVRAWAPIKKAHGGYVKKYAKGGGVRKVKT
jgi:hypothetical protein